MSNVPSAHICPQCHAAIPDGAPQGLCPACLLAAVAQPTEAGPAPLAKSPPPTREQVAAAFPQLEILELIGAGGMGFVFKARQLKLDRLVALKLLPPHLGADAAFAERFEREGRVLARLSHPNIVTVHDFGFAPSPIPHSPSPIPSVGFFYLLMEYVDGVNLRQAMRAGRFTPVQALEVVPKICEALQFAHEQGVLHRDIKPENILLDSKGRVKLVDFGIAKLLNAAEPNSPADSSRPQMEEGRTAENEICGRLESAGTKSLAVESALTSASAALGTPNYMAPEQRDRPAAVDHRADIYSLGVVFYEMLTGELPQGKFAAPSAKTPMDPRVDAVVLRALEHERDRRHQSAGEMKTQVETIASTPGSSRREEAPTSPFIYASFSQRLAAAIIDLLVLAPLVALHVAIASASKGAAVALVYPMAGAYAGYSIFCHARYGQTLGKRAVGIRVVQTNGARIGWREAWLRSAVDVGFSILGAVAQLWALSVVSNADYYNMGWMERSAKLAELEPVWLNWTSIVSQIWVWSELAVMFFNRERRSIHDFMAGTIVIAEQQKNGVVNSPPPVPPAHLGFFRRSVSWGVLLGFLATLSLIISLTFIIGGSAPSEWLKNSPLLSTRKLPPAAQSPNPSTPDGLALMAKLREHYNLASNLVVEGQTITTMGRPGQSAFEQSNQFEIKLARPSFYQVRWTSSPVGSYVHKGAAWSDGSGDWFWMDGTTPVGQASRQMALGGGEGVSGYVTTWLPDLFFGSAPWLEVLGGLRVEPDAVIEGETCAVLVGTNRNNPTRLWVSKRDGHLRQAEFLNTVTADQVAMMPANMPSNGLPTGTTIRTVQTYQRVITGQAMKPSDFKFAPPAK